MDDMGMVAICIGVFAGGFGIGGLYENWKNGRKKKK